MPGVIGREDNFCDTSTYERPYKEFEALKFGLYNNQAEIGFRINVASLFLYQLDLACHDCHVSRYYPKYSDDGKTPVAVFCP